MLFIYFIKFFELAFLASKNLHDVHATDMFLNKRIEIGNGIAHITKRNFYFFFEQLKEPKGKHLWENYCFWFATGILIFLSGSFFINILANVMEKDEIRRYWFLTYIADIIKNIFLAVGVLVMAKQSPNHEKFKKNIPYLDMN